MGQVATPVRAEPTQTAEHASQMASQAFEPQSTLPTPQEPPEEGGPPAEAGPFQAALVAALKRDPREVGTPPFHTRSISVLVLDIGCIGTSHLSRRKCVRGDLQVPDNMRR
jgi:hypothetical protein